MKKLDLLGQKFNHLTVIEKLEYDTKSKKRKWKCECDCKEENRNIVIASTNDIVQGHTKSCGCIKKESGKINAKIATKACTKYHPSIAAAKQVYFSDYDDGDLDFEKDFLILSKMNCYYCNIESSNTSRLFKPKCSDFYNENAIYKYSGLDRVDPNQPHNKNNVVPCCYTCNWAKSNYSYDEFINWISKINKYLFVDKNIEILTNNFKPKFNYLSIFDYIKIIKNIHTKEEFSNLLDTKRSKNPPIINCARLIYCNYHLYNISFEEFLWASLQPCSYCGSFQTNKSTIFKKTASQYYKDNCTFTYNGLDRIDPTKDHTADNCVPCCFMCNAAKSNMTLQEFLSWLQNLCSHTLSRLATQENSQTIPPLMPTPPSQTPLPPFSTSSD